MNSQHCIPCRQWKLLPSFAFLCSTTLLLLSCHERMLPRLEELALGRSLGRAVGHTGALHTCTRVGAQEIELNARISMDFTEE